MKLNSYILPGILAAAMLLSACGNNNKKQAKDAQNQKGNTEQIKEGAPKDEANKTRQEKMKGLSQKEMTSDVGLSESQIDSLYNTAKIDADGKDRPVNSLTAFEYLRFDDDVELFSAFAERYEVLRTYLEEKEGIVLFVPNDSYLENNGNERILMDVWNAKDKEAMSSILKGHVQLLEGKYIGGDYIYLKDLSKGKITQMRRKKGNWLYKQPITSDPILVKNGIIFKVDGMNIPEEYLK